MVAKIRNLQRVKQKCFEWLSLQAFGGWYSLDDRFQHVFHTHARFCGYTDDFRRVNTKRRLELRSYSFRLSRWKINLSGISHKKCQTEEVSISTLFKTGMIVSPRSFATWKTDIDCAWIPWLASTLSTSEAIFYASWDPYK